MYILKQYNNISPLDADDPKKLYRCDLRKQLLVDSLMITVG